MRAGPLSNTKVIAMLNRYYVPVYSSNEYAGPDGTGPPALSRKLLTNFYPQRDISSADRNSIELQWLRGTVISASGGTALAKLEGALKMKRSFYPGRDDYKPIKSMPRWLDFWNSALLHAELSGWR